MNPRRVQMLSRFGYDGGRFHGLAMQPDVPTAAAAFKARLLDAGLQPKALCYSARTDRGVHALRNAATFWAEGPIDLLKLSDSLGASRDDGLSDVTVVQVPISVHARASARDKHYRYSVRHGFAEQPLPIHALWERQEQGTHAWDVLNRLDVAAMRAAAEGLCGTHDFSSFRSRRCRFPDAVRQIDSLELTAGEILGSPSGGPFTLDVDIRGPRFLRQMVRIIVGTLIEVGCGARAPDSMAHVLEARSRNASGMTAPPQGLTLVDLQIAGT